MRIQNAPLSPGQRAPHVETPDCQFSTCLLPWLLSFGKSSDHQWAIIYFQAWVPFQLGSKLASFLVHPVLELNCRRILQDHKST